MEHNWKHSSRTGIIYCVKCDLIQQTSYYQGECLGEKMKLFGQGMSRLQEIKERNEGKSFAVSFPSITEVELRKEEENEKSTD